MSLVIREKAEFQHMIRLMNTNIDGSQKLPFALTSIKGIGRRFAILAVKRAGVNVNMRAGEITEEELARVVAVLQKPLEHKIPKYFLNRRKDFTNGTDSQLLSNLWDNKMREDFDRLKKIKAHRGIRHYYGWKVRGQHTKTTGRHGILIKFGRSGK